MLAEFEKGDDLRSKKLEEFGFGGVITFLLCVAARAGLFCRCCCLVLFFVLFLFVFLWFIF